MDCQAQALIAVDEITTMTQTNYFEVKCLAGHQGLVEGEDAEVLVRVDVQLAPSLARVARTRAAQSRICLVLDCSDSMNNIVSGAPRPTGRTHTNADGEHVMEVEGGTSKLDALIVAAKNAVALAKPGDQVTIIHFSSSVSAPFTADGANQPALLAAVERAATFPHQGTNMTAALDAARAVARTPSSASCSVLLFTDGMPQDEEGPRARAELLAEDGATLSTLGFGDDLRVSYVEDLAARGRGRAYTSRDPASLDAELAKAFESAQQVIVSNLRANLRFAPCVVPKDLHRAHPQSQLLRTFDPTTTESIVAVGAIGAEKWATLFLRLHVKGDQLPPLGRSQRLVQVTVTGDVASEKRVGESAVATVELPIVATPAPFNHAEVTDAFQMVQARELSARFEDLCRSGRYADAQPLAAQLRRIYQNVGSADARRADESLGAVLADLDRNGHISLQRLNELLNDVSASRTASGVKKPLGSETRAGAPPDSSGYRRSVPPDASATRRGNR